MLDDDSGNILLNNLKFVGATITFLNYYEYYTYPTTFTGCGTVTTFFSVQISKIGRVVTLSTTLDANFTATSAGTTSLTDPFPSRFSVATNHMHIPLHVINKRCFPNV